MTSYNILATGSKGNAIIYHEEILVDFGLAYIHVKPYLPKIKYLLLTHQHIDHFSIEGIITMRAEYPDIKIIGADFMIDKLAEIGMDNIYAIESGIFYQLDGYRISSFDLQHDVKNVGYRIFKEKPDFTFHKILHATDMYSLVGIEAKDYDVYAIEINHCEKIIARKIAIKRLLGEYPYQIKARRNHHSLQRANKWLAENNTNNGEVVILHQSDEGFLELAKKELEYFEE